MTQENNSTGKRHFKHLTESQRSKIEIMLKIEMPKTKIAETLGIARSTLYRELKRGTVKQLNSNLTTTEKYFYDAGQRVYEENRANCKRPLKMIEAFEFIKYAEEQILKNKLSPDAICGKEKLLGEFKVSVCAKTLYNYIDQGLLKVRNIDLPLRVRIKNKRQIVKKNRRLYGLSIEERPEYINERKEFGHWEIDTIVGAKGSGPVLLTLDERLTRKRILLKIEAKTDEAVVAAIGRLKERYGNNFRTIFKSVTSDNGCEFSRLQEAFDNSVIYYTHPYSAFERGTNEKQNSLVRRFLPKGKSFKNLTDDTVAHIEDWINNLPRKIFDYTTSEKLFESVLIDIAI